jgi:hypothetical protein
MTIHFARGPENGPALGEQRVNRGKLAVASMILLALLLAAFALWWNVTSGRQALEFWGQDGARRIADESDRVELLWLRPPAGESAENALIIGERTYAVAAAKEVTGARGLIHARRSLVQDASFVWGANDPLPAGHYSVAVRFRDDSGTTTAAFDFERLLIAHVESQGQQAAAAKIIEGWKEFAQRHRAASRTEDPPGR